MRSEKQWGTDPGGLGTTAGLWLLLCVNGARGGLEAEKQHAPSGPSWAPWPCGVADPGGPPGGARSCAAGPVCPAECPGSLFPETGLWSH